MGGYVAAVVGMLIAATAALTVFYTVDHLDAPEAPAQQPEADRQTIAV